jgi:peptide-methionine (S)-S-oxide reductase
VKGVISTRVGYTGGDRAKPSYGSVCSGDGHTEAILIDFDPAVVSYRELLDLFFANHDPFARMATQYASAVWPQTEAQKVAVFAAIERTEAARGRPVTTRVEPPKKFWDAEWYHQQYNGKNKIRLALASAVFYCNYLPHGAFPGQEGVKTVLGGLVFASLLPQLVAPFDRLLAIFD